MLKLKRGSLVHLHGEKNLATVTQVHKGNAIAQVVHDGYAIERILTPENEGTVWNRLF